MVVRSDLFKHTSFRTTRDAYPRFVDWNGWLGRVARGVRDLPSAAGADCLSRACWFPRLDAVTFVHGDAAQLAALRRWRPPWKRRGTAAGGRALRLRGASAGRRCKPSPVGRCGRALPPRQVGWRPSLFARVCHALLGCRRVKHR